MNLYLVSRTDKVDYDQYDAFVVAAPDESAAERLLNEEHDVDHEFSDWSPNVEVKLLGEATPDIEQGEILRSFNAG